MADRDTWEEVWKRFDPEQPAAKPSWRVHREHSPARQICEDLRVPMGGVKRFLLLGSIGSGKSTELLAIAEERAKSGPVVFLDLVEHFHERVADIRALQHVQAWEVLLLIGLGVYHAVDKFGHRWAKEDLRALERAGQAFSADDDEQPKFDAAKLASSVAVMAGGALGSLGPIGAVAGASLRLVSKAAEAGRWQFEIGRRDHRHHSDQDSRVQQLLDAVNGLIGVIQAKYATQLTIFVDGLDRIEEPATTRDLFVDSVLLGSLICPTIVTAPLTLRRESLAAQVRSFRPKVLANLPVIERRSPWTWDPGGAGLAVCLDLFNRRVDDLDRGCIPGPLLRQLGYYSGGRVRDFVRFVRMVSERAWSSNASQATAAMIDEVVDEHRRLVEMGINRRHLELLAELLDDQELPDDEKIPEMLNRGWILPYPNESEWYFPHPLLMKVKLADRRG
ncbi:MAG TPA: hypothetical protein VK034_20385 [Enhygromyxa sp.]|nr:hypothetical protein [Enhygromyxa sp.]